MRRSLLTTNEQVSDSIVLVFTGNDEALVSEWVKRVRDRDFACQNSDIMNCLPMPAADAQRPFTACSALPSLTVSTRNSICAMSWSASPIIRSTASTNSCPGTWPQSFQRISQHLKCPHKNRWTLEPPRLNHAAYQDGLETTLTFIIMMAGFVTQSSRRPPSLEWTGCFRVSPHARRSCSRANVRWIRPPDKCRVRPC